VYKFTVPGIQVRAQRPAVNHQHQRIFLACRVVARIEEDSFHLLVQRALPAHDLAAGGNLLFKLGIQRRELRAAGERCALERCLEPLFGAAGGAGEIDERLAVAADGEAEEIVHVLALQPRAVPMLAAARVACRLVARTGGQQRDEAVGDNRVGRGRIHGEIVRPRKVHILAPPRLHVVVIQPVDVGLVIDRVSRVGRDGVQPATVPCPVHLGSDDRAFGEYPLALTCGEVVEIRNRLHFLIVLIAQAALVQRRGPAAVGGNADRLDPIVVAREASDLAALHIDLEEPHGGRVQGVVDGARVVLLFLQLALVERQILFRRDQKVLAVNPVEILDVALQARERPGLAALRIDQPELRFRRLFGFVPLILAGLLGQRPVAEKGDEPAVRRPARTLVLVGPARQLNLQLRAQARLEKVRHHLVLVGVGTHLHPHRPLAVR
jgi:hypothetical protein